MSHVATVETVIMDLNALKKAAEECGLVMNFDQTTFKWYGAWVNDYHGNDAAYKHGIKPKDYGKCLHAISVPNKPGAYEIGVVARDDGGYLLLWDFFAGGYGLMDHVGKDCTKLLQSYSKHVVLNEIATNPDLIGYTPTIEYENENMIIKLTSYD